MFFCERAEAMHHRGLQTTLPASGPDLEMNDLGVKCGNVAFKSKDRLSFKNNLFI